MHTAPTTRPQLLGIQQTDKPIQFRKRGYANAGVTWTIQPGDPEALQRAIDMVNTHGGPDCWEISETAA